MLVRDFYSTLKHNLKKKKIKKADGEALMGGFSERERALESKFQHDKILEFKIIARRNRLFGLWVGKQMNLKVDEAEAFARELVGFSLLKPALDDLIAHVMTFMKERKTRLTENQLRKQLDYFQQDATQQILNE